MTGAILFWLAVLCYGVAGGIVVSALLHKVHKPSSLSWWLVAGGFALQSVLLGGNLARGGLRLNLSGSLELVVWVLAILYLIGWRIRPQDVRSAGMVLLPLMALFLVLGRLVSPAEGGERAVSDPWLLVHLLSSVIAYGLFSIAAVLAILDSLQDRALRTKHLGGLFTMLPAIGTLENALFGMIQTGFAFLTLSIGSGAVYSSQASGAAFHLSHKVVFTWATWLIFAVLIGGHHFYGWRGRRAVRMTLFGMAFLALSWLGVKFVQEVLLGRVG